MSPTREAVIEAMARAIYALAPPLEWIEFPQGGGSSGAPIPFDDERSGHYRSTAERHAAAALTAYESLAASQEGFVMVPREATPEMLQAFYDGEWMTQKPRPAEIWREMIAAALKDSLP